MSTAAYADPSEVEARARQSHGTSDTAIYEMVVKALDARGVAGGTLVDVGCGAGQLQPFMEPRFARYIGVDVVRYEDFPAESEFTQVDLDTGRVALPDASADVVAAVETIEHLENPRAFMRELVRLVRPGGWVVVTTPNQLSLLSLFTLTVKKRFSAFQDVHYPAHLTALLEVDLKRIARECGLVDFAVVYSCAGRIVLTSWHYPKFIARMLPRALSDNVLLIGRKNVAPASRP
ncbi:MAG: class I SAM-dependent methyltransferase [Pyrinomonadaceae bacterium]|nr:class I SAM-dependent methyltransferase [Pyrinomonadaceae bacterium]